MSKEYQKLEGRKIARDLYTLFEECLNYRHYGHAATLALLPQLKGDIPQAKITEVQDGLSDIIKSLDKLKIK